MANLTEVTADYEQARPPGLKASEKNRTCPEYGVADELFQPQLGQVSLPIKVCDNVDECQTEIRQRIDGFFAQCLDKVAPWVDDLLGGKMPVGRTSFYDTFLPQQKLDAHVEELRETIQRKAQGYFGVTALAVIAKIDLAARMDVFQLQALFAEYRRTLLVMQLAAVISNCACQQSLSGLKAPFLLDRLLEKLEIGSKILKMANCCPRQNRASYREAMITQVQGMLQTIRKQLSAEACYQAAVSFYELYDLVGEPQHEKKTVKHGKSANPLPTREEDPQGAARSLA